MIGAYLIGDKEVIAQLQGMPDRLRERLTSRIEDLAMKLEEHIKGDYLSGQVLNVRTGALRRSIHKLVISESHRVTGVVGSYDIKYAKIHEYGGTIDMPARQQTVFRKINKNGDFLHSGRFVKASKSNFATTHEVVAHTITMPARPFIHPALKDMRDDIVTGIEQSLEDVKKP